MEWQTADTASLSALEAENQYNKSFFLFFLTVPASFDGRDVREIFINSVGWTEIFSTLMEQTCSHTHSIFRMQADGSRKAFPDHVVPSHPATPSFQTNRAVKVEFNPNRLSQMLNDSNQITERSMNREFQTEESFQPHQEADFHSFHTSCSRLQEILLIAVFEPSSPKIRKQVRSFSTRLSTFYCATWYVMGTKSAINAMPGVVCWHCRAHLQLEESEVRELQQTTLTCPKLKRCCWCNGTGVDLSILYSEEEASTC